MALLEYTINGKVDKVEQAIRRIQLGALSTEPLYVCCVRWQGLRIN